jgi:ArsR family transcriptional regulator
LPPVEVAGPLAVRLWPARRMAAAAAMLPETTLQF